MKNSILRCMGPALIFASLAFTPNAAPGQQASGEKSASPQQEKRDVVYRLEYNVKELVDGRKVNARTYVGSAAEDSGCRIRVGSRIPINFGEKGGIQYQDIGINIDCSVRDRGDYLLLFTSFDSSSIVAADQGAGSGAPPVLRHVRFEGHWVLMPGKLTVIGSLDDVATDHRYEVEVTATKLK